MNSSTALADRWDREIQDYVRRLGERHTPAQIRQRLLDEVGIEESKEYRLREPIRRAEFRLRQLENQLHNMNEYDHGHQTIAEVRGEVHRAREELNSILQQRHSAVTRAHAYRTEAGEFQQIIAGAFSRDPAPPYGDRPPSFMTVDPHAHPSRQGTISSRHPPSVSTNLPPASHIATLSPTSPLGFSAFGSSDMPAHAGYDPDELLTPVSGPAGGDPFAGHRHSGNGSISPLSHTTNSRLSHFSTVSALTHNSQQHHSTQASSARQSPPRASPPRRSPPEEPFVPRPRQQPMRRSDTSAARIDENRRRAQAMRLGTEEESGDEENHEGPYSRRYR